MLDLSSNVLSRGNNMNRARWYSGSTVLLNGEVMHPGRLGRHRPSRESAQLDGTFRLLSGADTSTLDFMYPRNFIAPDGRVFGYDSDGRMYYVNPTGHRRDHAASASSPRAIAAAMRARRCSGPAASCSSAATRTARW